MQGKFDTKTVNRDMNYSYPTTMYEKEIEPRHEKTNVLVSDLVLHNSSCTAREDGWRLEISDLESRGIVLSMQRKQKR